MTSCTTLLYLGVQCDAKLGFKLAAHAVHVTAMHVTHGLELQGSGGGGGGGK